MFLALPPPLAWEGYKGQKGDGTADTLTDGTEPSPTASSLPLPIHTQNVIASYLTDVIDSTSTIQRASKTDISLLRGEMEKWKVVHESH